MSSIRDKIKADAGLSNLKKQIDRKQTRPSPGMNPVQSSAGFSGESSIRKMPNGSIQHAVKYQDDWYYRTYTKSGKDEFDISELIGVERIQSTIFYSNLYSGKGWGIWKNDKDDYTLEIDNLTVRRQMTIWELVINQLRASNGTFIVGSSAKIADNETGASVLPTGVANQYSVRFEMSSATHVGQPFKTGDVIACKRFWLKTTTDEPQSQTEQIVANVNETSYDGDHNRVILTVDTDNSFGDYRPHAGQEFVRVASSVVGRRGLVVLSSDGNETGTDVETRTPFIDIYDGLITYENFLAALGGDDDFIKVRMGRLDELTGNTNEFGLWTNTMYLIGAGIEGASGIHYGTRAEFNALTSAVTDTYHEGDLWIMTDELNNMLTWYPDGETVVGEAEDQFGNPQIHLTIGIEYTITTYYGTDDFTNVGAANNNEGTTFRATGTDPTEWLGSTLTQYWVDRTNETIIDFRTDIFGMLNEKSLFKEDKNIINIFERNHAFAVLGQITDSHIDQLAEATTWGVSSTVYTAAYDALYLYMNTTITWNNTGDSKTGVDGAVWIVKWGDFFNALADLKAAIAAAAEARIFTNANGRMYKAPTTGTPGLFASGTHLGYWNATGWMTYMDNSANFYLKGASNTCLQWTYSDATLYIGGTAASHSYLKTVAGAGNIEFHDIYDRTPMVIGSNLDASGVFSGIRLYQTGFIYKHNDSNDAVSTVHSELYNQTTNYIGGISSLVSTTTDALTPALPTVSIVTGFKALSYVTGNYNGSGVTVRCAGDTSGSIWGGYFYSENDSGSGNIYGVFGQGITLTGGGNTTGVHAIGYGGDVSYGIQATAAGGTTNWAGHFGSGNVLITNYLRVGGLANNTTSAFGLKFGSSEDTNLYRSAANTLKTDDALYVVGNITTDGTVDGRDINTWLGQSVATGASPSFVRLYATGAYLDTGSALTVANDSYVMFSGASQWLQWDASEVEFRVNSRMNADGGFADGGVNGIDSAGFVIAVGDTITVSGGLVTALSH